MGRNNAAATGRENTLAITTPEGIEFRMLIAGPVTRALAWGTDFLCIGAASIVLNNVLMLTGIVSRDFYQALYVISFFLFSAGYGITTEWFWRGQTVGKKLFRLRVVDIHGLKLQFSQVLIRNLMRIIDSMPALYLVGGLSCIINRHSQRLGDFVANTVVIRNPKINEPDLDQLLSGKYNSLREYPLLAARLRQHVSPAEAKIALQALVRRNEFDPESRVELFREVSSHFHTKVSFPEEATHGITDEQYIRNVVDILYHSKPQI
ncbi:MAG: transporter [Nitrospira bacterium SG8_35_4]|nr:MAG: transporter [Nitrospira bacterium SG8_35_4]